MMIAEYNLSFGSRFILLVVTAAMTLSTAATPGHAGIDQLLDEVCGTDLAPSGNSGADKNISQLRTYCAAAKSSDKAATINSALWKIWAGVATVCTTSCALSFTDTIVMSMGTTFNSYLSACGGASAMAGITDGLMTKNFRTAITALAGTVGGATLNGIVNKDGTKKIVESVPRAEGTQLAEGMPQPKLSRIDTIDENKKSGLRRTRENSEARDRGACLTAISASLTAFSKRKIMKDSEDSASKNLKSAQALIAQQTTGDSSRTVNLTLNGKTGDDTGTVNPSGIQSTSNSAKVLSTDPCTSTGNGVNSHALISCAISNDPSLPRFVSHRDFVKDFQKIVGMPLDKFMNDSQTPSDSILAGMRSAGFNAASLDKLSEVHRQMESYALKNNVNGSSYSHGGAAPFSTGAFPEPDLDALMTGVLEKFNSGPGGTNPGSAEEIGFKIHHRSPAAMIEDRAENIFERITARYKNIDEQLSLETTSK